MAITRTQIAKQLLAQGGRTGFQGGGADMGAPERAQERADRGYGSTNSVERDTGLERERQRNIALDKQLLDTPYEPFDTPFASINFLGNTLGKFGHKKTTKFFSDNSIGGKINPATGKPFGYGPQGYSDYMDQRTIGNVNAFGNPTTQYDDQDDNDAYLIPRSGIMAEAPSDMDQEPEIDEDEGLSRRFRANGGRIGFFKGAQADASAGKGAMSPGTDTGGGFRGGGDKGPKGPPSVISKSPKTNPIVERLKKRNLPGDSLFKKFLAHDKFTDMMKATNTPNYHQMGGLDFMARFPNINPDTAKKLASAYQNVFEVGRAIADGPGGKTIDDALNTAKAEAALNAIGIDAFSDPTSETYKQYTSDDFALKPAAVSMAEGGIMNPDIIGGEMDFESARQMYGLGKLVKKVTRSVKKIAKSPIGKVAIAAGLSGIPFGGGSFFGSGSLFGKAKPFLMDNIFGKVTDLGIPGPNRAKRVGGLFDLIKKNPLGSISAVSAVSGLLTAEQEEEAQLIADETGIDIAEIRANPDKYLGRRFRAEGGSMDEPVAKKTMPLLDMGGKEMDLRAEGGFVPIGRMEKADDVPARLSKNEFVFTAEAVRNAGEGDVDKGAEVMYNMMKNLESGGDVSEESQGLDGARKMFQTSQRLEEVL